MSTSDMMQHQDVGHMERRTMKQKAKLGGGIDKICAGQGLQC